MRCALAYIGACHLTMIDNDNLTLNNWENTVVSLASEQIFVGQKGEKLCAVSKQ